MTLSQEIEKALQGIRSSTRQLRHITTDMKNQILNELAEELESRQLEILEANKIDLRHLAQDESTAFRDRLTLDEKRIAGIAEGLRQVSRLTDPVNEMMSEETLKNGLILRKVRAPIGIIFMIFESRPNVILEAFSLAFKSGNAIILRGGSDSRETSSVIYKIMSDVLSKYNLGGKLFYGLQDYDRDIVRTLLKRKDLIDVVVPRGGEKLIAFVQSESLMPIIKNDRGLCHAYVDDEADLKMALSIVINGKTQRPGVCNSLETVLVHKDVAEDFLPALHKALAAFQVRWKVDPATAKILQGEMNLELAVEQNWGTEYLDFVINCRVVESLEQALDHIARYGSKHSETIITKSEDKARTFQNEVDAAAVYWNASTRFTDGFEFGLGGELGISTQKLHVRGPVGLNELTTPRWIIDGTGQIRE